MFRFILIIALAYLGFKVYKAWRAIQAGGRRAMEGSSAAGRIDDIMVKDPNCQVYFPKRKGIAMTVNGEELYFCSEQCRDQYRAKQSP